MPASFVACPTLPISGHRALARLARRVKVRFDVREEDHGPINPPREGSVLPFAGAGRDEGVSEPGPGRPLVHHASNARDVGGKQQSGVVSIYGHASGVKEGTRLGNQLQNGGERRGSGWAR